MTTSLSSDGSIPHVRRSAVFGGILLLTVAGSQWSMLWLAAVYSQRGRVADMVSPEAIIGICALLVALATVLVFRPHPSQQTVGPVGVLLTGFLLVACVGELLRPEMRSRNLLTFVSFGAYYVIGTEIGRVSAFRGGRLPVLTGLLAIYTVWYLVMLAFIVHGELGFHGVLPESRLLRLEFKEGFTATELPIPVGFQFPVLLYAWFAERAAGIRLWACVLALCAVALVVATVSAAALMALGLVVLVFLVAQRPRWSSWGVTATALGTLTATIGVALTLADPGGVIDSVAIKFANLISGEGPRAQIYRQLLLDMVNEPFGIGKGRFVEVHSLGWLGQGVYPHHNLLGIGAELGLPALALYIAFALGAIGLLGKRAFRGHSRHDRQLALLATMVLGAFLYQQFRGLFQDTWDTRETYLWLGIGVGSLMARVGPCAKTGATHLPVGGLRDRNLLK